MSAPMPQKDLEIKLRIEEMICYFLTVALPQYPAKDKKIIGDVTERKLSHLLDLVIVVNHRHYKKTTAREIDETLSCVRSWFRMARHRGFLQLKHHRQLSKMTWEIGCMLNGWMEWIKNNPPTTAKVEMAITERLPSYDFA